MKISTKEHISFEFDKFLPACANIFSLARYFGVSPFGYNIACLWSVLLFQMLLAIVVAAIWKIISVLAGWANVTDGRGMTARLSGSIFYTNALLSLWLSSKFVSSWKELSVFWIRSETIEGMRFPANPNIRKRVIGVSVFVAIWTLVEHILSMISATGIDCPPNEYFERYILSSHGFLVQRHEYNLWRAVPIFILSKLATILWNFQDLIIIVISMGLTSKYDRLNKYVCRIVKYENKVQNGFMVRQEKYTQNQIWRRLRESYVRQAALVRKVDGHIGSLILLSNINNLYFICLQLFLGINNITKGTFINKLYYFFSLGWLLLRACSVVLAAGDVHIHSKRALNYLNSCPSVAYNVEVKRLKKQLLKDCVVLTGMGLFALKRELLLQVAAAILKYELVLIQYDH
uniref:Antennal gustatory receptor sugar taste 64a n=1 Tax=Dendrolimus punctatus TaxID=238572 RepID=A0A2K8GL63_9NEOP|nr:antennal gustatory receptor sugar taste 64a [Dendrolimus punctatus]